MQPIERPPLIEVSDDMEALMSTHLDFLRKQGEHACRHYHTSYLHKRAWHAGRLLYQ